MGNALAGHKGFRPENIKLPKAVRDKHGPQERLRIKRSIALHANLERERREGKK